MLYLYNFTFFSWFYAVDKALSTCSNVSCHIVPWIPPRTVQHVSSYHFVSTQQGSKTPRATCEIAPQIPPATSIAAKTPHPATISLSHEVPRDWNETQMQVIATSPSASHVLLSCSSRKSHSLLPKSERGTHVDLWHVETVISGTSSHYSSTLRLRLTGFLLMFCRDPSSR